MILLTDGQQRKTLAAARSLGTKNISVLVSEETRMNPSGFSRYCKKSLICPNPAYEPERYYEWLKHTIKRFDCDVMFPMDDCSMQAVMKHREEFESMCTLPIPCYDSYIKACDKGEAVKIALEAGADCPKTYMPANWGEVEILADEINYPAVIKPRLSSGSRGIRKVYSKQELHRLYEQIHKDYPEPIVQEYIGSGVRYDVCLLYDMEGRLKASFVQKELRHFPVEMGPSTIQESVYYPELLEKSLLIMKKLPWRGVVELEYMIDGRDGKPKFMEINPRFWASVQTAIYAGVDFPWLLYNISKGNNISGVHEYKTGIRCRWLLPGDMLHLLTVKKRLCMDPPFFSKIRDDIAWLKDPMPVLGFMLACLRYLFNFKMWKMMFGR